MKTLILLLLILQSALSFAQEIKLQLRSRDLGLNGQIKAPEGITISPAGVIYTTSMKTGKIYASKKPDYVPVEVMDLGKLVGWKKGNKPKALGILAENENQFWVALPNVWGGCIYSLIKREKDFIAKPAFCKAGDVNGLVIDYSRNRLYATSRETGLGTAGMIISIPLKELKASVQNNSLINYDSSKHRLIEADMPNGLVLTDNFLIFVQTMEDKVSAVNLKTKKVHTLFESDDSGWLDGLVYLKEHKLFLVADSKLGKLYFFKANGEKVQTIEVLNLEGNPTGLASLAVLGDRVYITDMWKGSLYGKTVEELTGSDKMMTYHSRVYNLSIKELLNFKPH